jgi:hypothetical protein
MKIYNRIASGVKAFVAMIRAGSPLVVNVLIVLLGFFTAISAFDLLAKNVKTSDDKIPKKDTVYVQVLNAGALNVSQVAQMDSGAAGRTSRDTQAIAMQDSLPKSSFIPTAINVTPITSLEEKAAISQYIIVKEQFAFWALVIVSSIIIIGLFYLLYYYLPPYSLGMRLIVDPPVLKQTFEKFRPEIESLGNPRKIKRLSNKVRFQFYYLDKQGVANDGNIWSMFKILIYFEKENLQAPSDKKAEEITGSQTGFTNFFREQSITSVDDKFMRLMYALNKH